MIQVTAATGACRRDALRFLFSDVPETDRTARVDEVIESAESGELDLNGLLTAKIDGQPVGTALVVFRQNGPAYVWPPVVQYDGDTDVVADALLQQIRRLIEEKDSWIGQCLLDPEQTEAQKILSRNGFPRLVELLFMQRLLSEPLPALVHPELESEEYHASRNHNRFTHLIEQTYIGSLDCPELNGCRTGEEALRSHQAEGDFHPSRFRIFRYNHQDVGLLLMTEHAEFRSWEVVYMGVLSEFRGRGFGRAIMLAGLQHAQSSGVESVLLSVDRRNDYARALYTQLGFFPVSTRIVHAWLRK